MEELRDMLDELLDIYECSYELTKTFLGEDEEVEDIINRGKALITKYQEV